MAHLSMNRRDFLRGSLAAATVAACQGPTLAAEAKPIFRLSLAEWSFHQHLFGRAEPKMDNLDFAKTARDFGIEGLEYVNQFFADKGTDETYLTQMKQRAADMGVQSLLIMVDGEGALGNPDKAQRAEVVHKHHKWIDAAKFLGCHSIRVNAQSDGKLRLDEQMKLAADGLRQLTEYGAAQDINVIVENHGGPSSNGKWLVGVMKLVDHPRCGILPDFGNFAVDRRTNEWYDRYQGVAEFMPYAKAVSAKSYDFDEDRPWVTVDKGSGKETDFLKMMRIVLDAGYRSWVGIEFEGRMDEYEGVRATKDLLERVRTELTPDYT